MDEKSTFTIRKLTEVSAKLNSLNVSHVLIGASAMAIHGYARLTADIDLAANVDPFRVLPSLNEEFSKLGFVTELVLPDAEDPLGGVLTLTHPDMDPIQIVNFYNPHNRGASDIVAAMMRACTTEAGIPIATVPYLIALKLFAGGRQSQIDALELLECNPEEIESSRELCARFHLADEFKSLGFP